MRRKSNQRKREKTTIKSPKAKKSESLTRVEKKSNVIQRTPTKTPEQYLQDERWDILPKTDYTYARSGSYSPRFFGRKYVNPNMSRYRIRGKGVPSGQNSEQEGADYDGYLSSEYSDEERVGKELHDSDSDVSYEKVLEDGIELRSGKSLKTMKEILHEHDKRLQQSELIRSTSRTSYTTSQIDSMSRSRRDYDFNKNAQTRSNNKMLKSKQNERQYSESESKTASSSYMDSYPTNFMDYRNVRSRRNLNTDFSTHSNLIQKDSNTTSLKDSSDYSYSKSGYDNADDRSRSGYTLRTTKTTVTEEYSNPVGGEIEKFAIEDSEKQSRSKRQSNISHQHNNINLYGLDSEGEFSDTDSRSASSSKYSSNSRSRSGGYSDVTRSSSTVSTVISSITETVSTITSPIISPLWNTVCRPAWHYVVQPVTYIALSLLYCTWLILTRPVIYLIQSVRLFVSWLRHSELEEIFESVLALPEWLLHKMEFISWQFVTMDAWFFKRRRNRTCCLCLPLLLLLPLMIALLTGVDVLKSSSAFIGMFSRNTSSPVNIEKHEYFHHLNDEVRSMVLALQSSNQNQLTAADVEAIVYRIVGKETDTLKASVQLDREWERKQQGQWKSEQSEKLQEMQSRYDALLAIIKDLEEMITVQRTGMADQGEHMKAESVLQLVGLEKKLALLQAELRALEKDHAALLTKVTVCCHNETYYLATVKDNVLSVLTEIMKGKVTGNPQQRDLTNWLHTNFVSNEDMQAKLDNLASELTFKVLAMINEHYQKFERTQQQQQQQQQDLQPHQMHVMANESGIGVEVIQVRALIDEALFRFSADKTGIADFALESGGGTVLSTRCSESFYRKTALVSVFGIPLWYTSNSPRTVIQPEVNPGQCWAFRGSQGYVVIQTSTIIIPSGFTLEHIPKSLAPSGEIDSAPKDFTVLGLENEYDDKGVSLGTFTYKDDGKPIQFFPIQVIGNPKPFNLFELRILGNYGNLEYTCLYRFRIHGKPFKR